MKGCSFCIPVDNWGDFSALTLALNPLLVMRLADFSGFGETVRGFPNPSPNSGEGSVCDTQMRGEVVVKFSVITALCAEVLQWMHMLILLATIYVRY